MPATTCPHCAAGLDLPPTQHPYVTCPRCLGIVWNVEAGGERRAPAVDDEVRRDRLAANAGLILLGLLTVGSLLLIGSEAAQWVVCGAVMGWALVSLPKARARQVGTLERVLRAGAVFLAVVLLMALAVFAYLFIQCMELTRGMG